MNRYLQKLLFCACAIVSLAIPSLTQAMDKTPMPTLTTILTCPAHSPAGNDILDYLSFEDIDNIHQTCRALKTVWNKHSTIRLWCDFCHSTQNIFMYLQKLATFFAAIKANNPIHLYLDIERPCQTRWLLNHANNLRNLNVEQLIIKRDCWPPKIPEEELGQLCSLWPCVKTLILDNNELTSCPSHLKQLKQLTSLSVVHNNLSLKAIAQLCHYCPGLKQLDLRDNSYDQIPPEIQQLKNLTYLTVKYHGNDHTAVVNLFTCCPRLIELRLMISNLTTREEKEQMRQLVWKVRELAPSTAIEVFEEELDPCHFNQFSYIPLFFKIVCSNVNNH